MGDIGGGLGRDGAAGGKVVEEFHFVGEGGGEVAGPSFTDVETMRREAAELIVKGGVASGADGGFPVGGLENDAERNAVAVGDKDLGGAGALTEGGDGFVVAENDEDGGVMQPPVGEGGLDLDEAGEGFGKEIAKGGNLREAGGGESCSGWVRREGGRG